MTNVFRPYMFITGFGLVSMFMDIVYEGALSVQGPLLLSLGATAGLVGLVSGLGEATSLAGRLVSGPAADRTGKYWAFCLLGYLITALAVPAMGIANSVAVVAALIIVERLGKSIRTPSRDTMLASASGAVGRGRGFALHEVLDQVGAICGPLIVAAILAATSDNYAPALGVMLVPGAIAVAILLFLRAKVPNPALYEPVAGEAEEAGEAREVGEAAGPAGSAQVEASAESAAESPRGQVGSALVAVAAPTPRPTLPGSFWMYALACGLCLTGVATFAVMSYHAVSCGILAPAAVPVVYAVAMGCDAVAAFVTGNLYDRIGPRTILALPVLGACIPLVAYGTSLVPVVAGAVIWGLCTGIQEATMRAYVADLVVPSSRATAYGYFSVFTGVGTLLGGSIAGALYGALGGGAVAVWTLVVQAVVLVLLGRLTLR